MQNLPIPKLLLKMSPPVMLTLLIVSVYNVVDSYFVAQYSQTGLAALSLVYPLQLLLTAFSTGTGTGVNILISRLDGTGQKDRIHDVVRTALILGVFCGLVYLCAAFAGMGTYFAMNTRQADVAQAGILYFRLVSLFAPVLFLEAVCTKMLQAKGNMVLPMVGQVCGALSNIILDPILIFGLLGMPALGITGAAIATVVGQSISMVIVFGGVIHHFSLKKGQFSFWLRGQILKESVAPILSQALGALYVVGLNLVLKSFSEDAVTVLGIYYKIQTFFFIPLMGLQQVILPIVSFNYGAGQYKRIQETLNWSLGISCVLMSLGTLIFLFFPEQLVGIFSHEPSILAIGPTAFRTISLNFIPAGITLMLSVYFQGINRSNDCILAMVLRQVVLLVPLAWLFHFFGLEAVWLTFPVTEGIVAIVCLILYHRNRTILVSRYLPAAVLS